MLPYPEINSIFITLVDLKTLPNFGVIIGNNESDASEISSTPLTWKQILNIYIYIYLQNLGKVARFFSLSDMY